MNVASWLRSLGLEQYEAAFRENAKDLSVLPDLTDQDLEKARRPARPSPQTTACHSQPRNNREDRRGYGYTSPRDTAERRQVTVMFSDLVPCYNRKSPCRGIEYGHGRLATDQDCTG
jgi:hypothetical protein